MGEVKQRYIHSVYVDRLYQQVIAEESMKAAVEHVKKPSLQVESTHRIVGIATLSRQDHRVAQTREVACTKIVLPQVIARGLNITEVAHDYQSTIKQYAEGLGMVNSYDTWHGFDRVWISASLCGKEIISSPSISPRSLNSYQNFWYSLNLIL
eukprot:Em0015g1199a